MASSLLTKRPMGRVTDHLERMGARLEWSGARGMLPATLAGGRLSAIDHVQSVASAQVKSAVLLAGLYAEGETSVTEPAPTRDHTERMLGGFGVPVRRDGATSTVAGGARLARRRGDRRRRRPVRARPLHCERGG